MLRSDSERKNSLGNTIEDPLHIHPGGTNQGQKVYACLGLLCVFCCICTMLSFKDLNLADVHTLRYISSLSTADHLCSGTAAPAEHHYSFVEKLQDAA